MRSVTISEKKHEGIELFQPGGLTQRQLADELGISDKTVSKWECGVTHN